MQKAWHWLVLLSLWALLSPGWALHWESAHPGGGGPFQGITLDPNATGRLYLCAREGCYRSDNNGERWTYLGAGLNQPDCLTIAVEPGEPKRLYAGTVYGLCISDSGGERWTPVPSVSKTGIMTIAINPDVAEEIYAGPGYRDRAEQLRPTLQALGCTVGGAGRIYHSLDHGRTWRSTVYTTTEGLHEVYSIVFHPKNRQLVFLGTRDGIYRTIDGGQSWQQVPAPFGTLDGKGITLSPDGKVLYAVFEVPPAGKAPAAGTRPTVLFATQAGTINWQRLDGNGFDPGLDADKRPQAVYWMPQMDPRSTGNTHRFLCGTTDPRLGLFECTAVWQADRLREYTWKRVLFWDAAGNRPTFDVGWESRAPRCLTFAYTPATWLRRGIWATGGQTFYTVDTGEPDSLVYDDAWQQRYCRFVREYPRTLGRPLRTYQTRGIQSTVNYDCDTYQSYAIQAQADNGVLESWDGGVAWGWKTIANREITRSQAVTILKGLDPPIVLCHAEEGENNGMLWGKRLTKASPADPWVLLGGGAERRGGLPGCSYQAMATDPRNPKCVYLALAPNPGSAAGESLGIYCIADITAMFDAAVAMRGRPYAGTFAVSITAGSPLEKVAASRVFVDPYDATIVYGCFAGGVGIWKGVNENGAWSWTPLRTGRERELAVWGYDGRTYLACVYEQGDARTRLCALELSSDGGKSWRAVLKPETVIPLRANAWYLPEMRGSLTFAGLVGHENLLFCSFQSSRWAKGYGLFQGTIQPDGGLAWTDITGNLPFALVNSARVLDRDDGRFLYLSTNGAGLWRAKIAGGTPFSGMAQP